MKLINLSLCIDELGTAFAPVKSDITGNIVKIRATFDEHPNNSKTLQALVKNEIALANSRGVDALLWLKRGLEFTSTALRRNLENKNEELNKSFTKAYGDTLSKHHSIFVRPIFSVAMKACPYRKDFYESLVSEGTSLEDTYALMEKWLSALENIVRILVAFYVELKLEA